jgi:hypothetical protein
MKALFYAGIIGGYNQGFQVERKSWRLEFLRETGKIPLAQVPATSNSSWDFFKSTQIILCALTDI